MKKIFYLLIFIFSYNSQLDAQSDPQLSFPWAVGQVWWLHHGPHDNAGTNNPDPQTWSSLDFAPRPGASHGVFPARPGHVVPSTCPIKVVIDHGDGWFTGYFHLINIPENIANSDGTVWVDRNTFIGSASTAAQCGGLANTAHVHISLRYGNQWNYVPIWDRYIGGWKIEKGELVRGGSLNRIGKKIERPRNSIKWIMDPKSCLLNDGTIGNNYASNQNVNIFGDIYGEVDLLAMTHQNINMSASLIDDEYIENEGDKGGTMLLIADGQINCEGNFESDQLSKVTLTPNLDGPMNRIHDNLKNEDDQLLTEDTDHDFTVSPNPFKNEFSISFQLANEEIVSSKIFSTSGQLVYVPFEQKLFPAGDHQEWIKPINLKSGIYLLNLQIGSRLITKPIVVI